MALWWILTLILFIVIIFFPKSENEKRKLRLLKKIPGPLNLPFLGILLPLFFTNKVGKGRYVERIVKKHGPVFYWRLGPYPYVDITKPEYLEEVLKSTEMIDKSSMYEFFHSWLGTGLLTSTGLKWFKHRKIITPTFHFSILEGFFNIFKEKADILVHKLQNQVGSEGFSIYPYLSRCALDVICETAMGTSLNAQSEESSSYVEAIYKMTETITLRIENPFYHSDFIYKLSPLGRTEARNLKILNGVVKKVIEERKEKKQINGNTNEINDDLDIGRKRRVAFLDMLLEARESGETLTDQDILDEVHTFMFEGHDTVSMAMAWTIFELGHHPDIQDRVYEELEEIFEGSDHEPTMNDISKMSYLDRVIKETLRLHPSVPFFARSVRKEFEIGGYTVPAGVFVDIPIFVMHRDPKTFPNPNAFNPDHFLPERILYRHPFAYIPFSAGSRNCIGQKFAVLEMKTLLSKILRNFEVRSLGKRENIQFSFDVINRPSGEINITINPRKK